MNDTIHKIASALIAFGFIVVPQIFVAPVPVFRFLIPSMLLYVLVVLIYNRFYLKWVGKYSFWTWLRMAAFLVSWFGIFLVLPSEQTRGLFLILSLPIIYILEAFAGNVGERVTFNELLLTAGSFFIFSFSATHYFFFPSFQSAFFIMAVFVLVTLMVRIFYEFTPLSSREQWLVAVVFGLLISQLWWVLTFLPFHYSVLGIMLLVLFYSLWSLYYYFVFHHLTRRKLQFQLIMSGIALLLLFISTRWFIIK